MPPGPFPKADRKEEEAKDVEADDDDIEHDTSTPGWRQYTDRLIVSAQVAYVIGLDAGGIWGKSTQEGYGAKFLRPSERKWIADYFNGRVERRPATVRIMDKERRVIRSEEDTIVLICQSFRCVLQKSTRAVIISWSEDSSVVPQELVIYIYTDIQIFINLSVMRYVLLSL